MQAAAGRIRHHQQAAGTDHAVRNVIPPLGDLRYPSHLNEDQRHSTEDRPGACINESTNLGKKVHRFKRVPAWFGFSLKK
ncbi:uncharacterized protein BP5553_00375 [Venustampulla echinocandica]|uniref:Uncharacterized protein n=1 Tax=Venustampulla echinocandica TaxID=2656787 RepID=A0A370TXZ1_9HELO|nr:uncharacterized protein BP5553_00375 [Venustampulla echinocandica]RDL40396.1 hypothetical protein BP5553_00375 [Venustampulla echinocandica]